MRAPGVIVLPFLLSSCGVAGVTIAPPRDLPAPCCARQETKGVARHLAEPRPGLPLGLGEALRIVLSRSPALAVAERGRCLGAAQILEARQLPNPELHLDVEDWLGSGPARGARLLQLTVQVSQEIALGGKRRARVQAARAAARAADWRVAALRLELLGKATLAFLDVLHAQELVGRQAALEANAVRVQRDLSDMEVAGRVLAPVVAQARIRLVLAQVERRRAEARLTETRLVLVGLWGSHEASFSKAEGALTRVPEAPSLAALLSAVEAHPALRVQDAAVASARARAEAERRAAWPALGLRAGYRYLHGEEASALVLGVSLPLPLFFRNQGAMEEARVRAERAQLERERAAITLRSNLVRAHGRLRALVEEAHTLGREVLPLARRSFALLEEGYRLGRVQSLELLEAARTLIEVEERTLGAQHQAHRALVELKRLAGALPLEGGAVVERSRGATGTAPPPGAREERP